MGWLMPPQATSALAALRTRNLSRGERPVYSPVSAASAPAAVSSASPRRTASSTSAVAVASYVTSRPASGKPPPSPSSIVPRCLSLTTSSDPRGYHRSVTPKLIRLRSVERDDDRSRPRERLTSYDSPSPSSERGEASTPVMGKSMRPETSRSSGPSA